MSRVRSMGLSALVLGLLVVSAAACSSGGDDQADSTTSRPNMVYKTGLAKDNDLGVCGAYGVVQMKKEVGGGNSFRILAPTPIGKKGDEVVGQRCAWEQRPGGDKVRRLTVEARKWEDPGELISSYDELRSQTVGAVDVTGLGDAAFSAVSPTATLLQVRRGPYFLTYSSAGEGGLTAVPLETLEAMARVGLEKAS